MPTVALIAWPFVALVLFRALGPVRGVIWATLAGALLLPEAFSLDIPGLPPYDKNTAIAAGLLAGMWLVRPDRPEAGRTGWDMRLVTALAALAVLSPVLTVLTNREPLVYGPTLVPGLGLRDLITMCSQSLILLIPFLAARQRLGDPDSHRLMLEAFVAAGLGYSLLVLFEVRMSPQLHSWVYGYFQHQWAQHVRGGGFRPIVFQPHGLWIGIFLLACAMAAFALLRGEGREARARVPWAVAGFWLIAVLFLSRNFGATALALLFLPVLWLWRSRSQVRLAMVIVLAFLAYPALRQAGLVPIAQVVELTGGVAPERQASFLVRLENEDAFLARAAEKPLAGWGIWARWRIWNPDTGEEESTSDGRWISLLGERGWLGYVAFFGTLSLSVLFLPRAAGGQPVPAATAGAALIIAATLIYQIPNNTIGPMTMLVAGSLAGFLRRRAEAPAEARADPAAAPGADPAAARPPAPAGGQAGGLAGGLAGGRPGPRYTRFPGAGGAARPRAARLPDRT